MYRLLISDLDGTLRSFGGDVSPAVRELTRRAMARGTLFTIATGRVFQSALPFAVELEINAPLICCDGALIIDHRNRTEILKRTIPAPVIQDAIRCANEEGLRLAIYFDDYRTHLERDVDTGAFSEWVDGVKKRPVEDPFAYAGCEPIHCLFPTDNEETTLRILPRLQARLGHALRPTRTTPRLIEAILPDVSKARGAAALATHLGIRREEVMALGDSDNDVELLSWAGLGIAVGNATPAARAAAAHVVASAQEDGAAEALERFILTARRAEP